MIKRKLSPEEKITAVELYLNGVQQLHTIVEHYGIAKESFRTWVRNYQIFGREGLRDKHRQTSYSTEIQTAAVRDYLSGLGSQAEICKKIRISPLPICVPRRIILKIIFNLPHGEQAVNVFPGMSGILNDHMTGCLGISERDHIDLAQVFRNADLAGCK